MTDPVPLREIEIVDYDPHWAREFETYATPVAAALGSLIMSVEHVGSTSVAGLAAKPVIDLDVVISSRLKLEPVIAKLAAIGYRHEGDLGIPGREAFRWPPGPRHHLYVCSVDTPNLHNHLQLRDYLRAHPDAVEAYGALKRELAARYPHDAEAYTAGKSAFIERTLAEARAVYGP